MLFFARSGGATKARSASHSRAVLAYVSRLEAGFLAADETIFSRPWRGTPETADEEREMIADG
jgi:hypothetical protein